MAFFVLFLFLFARFLIVVLFILDKNSLDSAPDGLFLGQGRDSAADALRQDGAKFQQYLDVQAKFDRYSVTNALLIQAQMPEATKLKSFDGWKETGASIRKNAKGISILEPGEEYWRENGAVGTS